MRLLKFVNYWHPNYFSSEIVTNKDNHPIIYSAAGQISTCDGSIRVYRDYFPIMRSFVVTTVKG